MSRKVLAFFAVVACALAVHAAELSAESLAGLSVVDHVEAIAQQLPEVHAPAFAALKEVVNTNGNQSDVSSVLDAVHENLRGEDERATERFQAARAAVASRLARIRKTLRNLKRAAFLDARKLASALTRRNATEVRLKRTRNQLSRAAQRLVRTEFDLNRLKSSKMSRIRTLNNQILDAQTRVKTLVAVARSLAETFPPEKPARVFVETAAAVDDEHPVLLQLQTILGADSESESESESESSAESLSDAEVEARAAAIIANDDENDAADSEADMQDIEDEESALDADEVDASIAAESEGESAAERAPAVQEQRMLQVLQTLASTTPGDENPSELLALVQGMIVSQRKGVKELVAARREVLGEYRSRSLELRKLVIRARLSVRRLRARIHRLERKSERLGRVATHTVAALKENRQQTKWYERRLAAVKANWAERKQHYTAVRRRRHNQMKMVRQLQRRLAAYAKKHAPITLPADTLGGNYRWIAGPWASCAAQPCTHIPIDSTVRAVARNRTTAGVTTRKVECYDFTHKLVDASLCASQAAPRRTRPCAPKPCPRDCVLGAWQWPKKCSTECGTGVRTAHRSVLMPARYGGACPALTGASKGLVDSKPCFSVKGCTSKRQKRAAFKALRARLAAEKAAGVKPPKDPRHTPSKDDDTSHVWAAWMKKFNAKKTMPEDGAAAAAEKPKAQAQAQAKPKAQPSAVKVNLVKELPKPKRSQREAKRKAALQAIKRREAERKRKRQQKRAAQRKLKKRQQKRAAAQRKRQAPAKPQRKRQAPAKPQRKGKGKRSAAQRKRSVAERKARAERRRLARKLRSAQKKDAAAAAGQTVAPTPLRRWTHNPRNRRCLKCEKGDRKCKIANCLWKAQRKACKACGDKKKCRKQKCRAVIRARREHLRRAAARRTRCMNCQKGQGKCKVKNCLKKAQTAECKTCAAGDAGKACRIEKCRKPANARRLNLIQRAKNNRCMKCAKQGRGAPECKRRNCLNKEQKADCQTCKEGDAKCREEKCRAVWRAQRKALFAAEAARVAAKDLKSMEQTPAPATAAATAAPAKAEAKAKAKPATVQQKRKAKALRCLNCRKADRACKLKHCMNKAQRKACISCPKGAGGDKCRMEKCSAVVRNRRAALKARIAKANRKAPAQAQSAGAKAPARRWTFTPRNRKCLKCSERDCKIKSCLWKAQRKACRACGTGKGKKSKACRKAKCAAAIRERRQHLRRAGARRTRCLNCQTFPCKFKNCMTAAQQIACKACAKGDAGKACREDKCRAVSDARRQHLSQRAKNNRCMKCAKQGRGAPECKRRNCLNKEQKADCKTCKEGDAKCREEKCRSVWRAQRKTLFAAEAARIAAKDAEGVSQTPAPATAAPAKAAASAEKPKAQKPKAKKPKAKKPKSKKPKAVAAKPKAAAASASQSLPQTQAHAKKRRWTHTPRNRRCLKCVKGDRKCKLANCLWKAERKACKACGNNKACRKQKCRAVIQARRKHLQRVSARRSRCMNCKKGQGKCKRQNCLTKAQLKECETCAKGDAGKACRIEKCRGPANARRQHLIKTAKNNRCMKCAKQGRGASECKFHNCLNKAQKADCQTCKEGKDWKTCREQKCRSVWRAQRKALFAAEAKAIAAKDAESALKADVPSAAAISAANAIPAPRVAKPRAFWYKPSGVQSESARVTRWRDASKRKRDLVSVGDAQHSPKFEAGAKAVSFQHTGLQSESSVKLGNKFDVIAVLTFTGDVNKPDNRWGAASAFMVNAPGATPSDPFQHGISGGVGVAVSEGGLRLIAEGKAWGEGGAPIVANRPYIVRLRRLNATKFQLFVGPHAPATFVDVPTKPAATLESAIISGNTDTRLKLGTSDALYFGWEGQISEVIGYNHLLSDDRIRAIYSRLAKQYNVPM